MIELEKYMLHSNVKLTKNEHAFYFSRITDEIIFRYPSVSRTYLGHSQHWSVIKECMVGVVVREAFLKFMLGAFGHCPFSFCTPPRTQTGTLGHFFPGRFERLYQTTVLRVYKCHKESWQALNPLLTKENT